MVSPPEPLPYSLAKELGRPSDARSRITPTLTEKGRTTATSILCTKQTSSLRIPALILVNGAPQVHVCGRPPHIPPKIWTYDPDPNEPLIL